MNDLEKFYQENQINISWKILTPIIIFSLLISWFFSKYGLKDILIFIENFVKTYPNLSYFLAFLSALVEGTIILALAPGTMAVLIFGALSVKILSFWVLLIVVIIGAFLGDNLGYILGRYFKKDILKSGIIDPLQYKIAEKFLGEHGGKAVFLARFMNGIKEFVPFIAGSLSMEQRKFQFFNFLGSIGWAILWLSLGRIFYHNLEWVDQNIGKVFSFLGIVFLIFSFRYFQKHKEELLKK